MTQAELTTNVVADPVTRSADLPTTVKASDPVVGSSQPRRRPWIVVVAGLMLVGLGWGATSVVRSGAWKAEDPITKLPKMTVAKVDLSTVLTAWGRVESSQNTIITCEIERLEMRSEGRTVTSGGSSAILTLVPEGTEVKKGDILCTLDGSEYDELVRTQEIKSEQVTAALKQAQLSLEVAEMGVREYREGLFNQTVQTLEGTVVMAESDLERATDRLQWTEKMLGKGYLPKASRSTAIQTLNQYRLSLQVSRDDLKNFRAFGHNRSLMELDAEVEKRRAEVVANTQRYNRTFERLAHYKKMLDNCTIKAPHDGFLIYSVDPTRPGAAPIETGMIVRQSQKLFYLPDLSKMQVVTYLHESVANQVREGMRARARIEGLNNRSLEGHIISVAPLPTTAGNWLSGDVKYFVGMVQLDSVPRGMLPGMTAEVEVDVDRSLDVLAVPSEAIAVEQGHNICYVAGIDGLERRPVTLGRSSRDLLEVKKGLAEGDQVVLRPDRIDSIGSMVVSSSKQSDIETESTSESTIHSSSPVSIE